MSGSWPAVWGPRSGLPTPGREDITAATPGPRPDAHREGSLVPTGLRRRDGRAALPSVPHRVRRLSRRPSRRLHGEESRSALRHRGTGGRVQRRVQL